MKIKLTERIGVTKNGDLTYRLSFSETVYGEKVTGRISYVFKDGESTMTHGNPFDVRAAWHRLCRINRAKRNGRDYFDLINKMGNRERRALGHPMLCEAHPMFRR